MTTLLWFKRDLRIHDHPALALAARDDRVVPLYIVEPEYWALPDTSGRQYAFLQESLSDLQTALRHLGSDLVIRVGDAVTVFQELYQTVKFDHVISHEETGNTWTFARDKRVAAWARRQGVRWTERPQSGVVRRLQGRDGWGGQRNAFIAQAQIEAPKVLPPCDLPSDPVPNLCAPDPCSGRQKGGA